MISGNGTHYDLIGPDGAPVVVLIHGLGLRRACWQWQVPVLAERFRVLAYDLWGHGDSPAAPDTPSLTVFSKQLADLLGELKIERAAIAGFSMGGMICRRFAMDHPDRTSALAILHSPPARSLDAQAAVEARVTQARAEGPGSTVENALERWFTEPYRLANPDVMDLVRSWVLANDRQIYPLNYHVLAHGVAELVAPMPPIQCPTLVMTGDEDFGNGPDMTHAIAAEIAGAEAIILPGLRHMALAEDPDAFNAPLMNFLNRTLETTL